MTAPDRAVAGEQESGAALLEVENLATRYPVRRGLTERFTGRPRRWVHAVDGVSFTLARGGIGGSQAQRRELITGALERAGPCSTRCARTGSWASS